METLLHIVQTINFYLSDYILVVLLVGTGVFFSLRTRFVQVRCFGEGMRRVFGGFSMRGGRQKGGLSSFQALTTAIAAQVGTGNIIGSCSAILVGGPVPSSGCGSSLFSGCPPFTPRPFWPRRLGWSMRTAPSPAACLLH